MANKNPFANGTVKQGARVTFLKCPQLKMRFKFVGVGPQLVCEVDEDCRWLVDGRADFIVDRKEVVWSND